MLFTFIEKGCAAKDMFRRIYEAVYYDFFVHL